MRAAALLLFLFASCSQDARSAAEERASLESFTASLEERIPALMDRYDVPGLCLGVIVDRRLVWSRAYGFADLEAGRPMTLEAVFRAESISKSVTTWGVMRLVEQGILDLDEPVERYLGSWRFPESEFDESEVTVRRLLSNNAGMPLGDIGDEYSPRDPMPSLRETLTREARLVREPGTGFLYSNAGFHLLELIVEETTGRDFAEYMAAEVLGPLGMDESSFAWSPELDSKVPSGYDLKGNPVPVYVYPAKASGGLFASLDDIARFVVAGMKGSAGERGGVLGETTIRRLYRAETSDAGVFSVVADSYGLGHFLEDVSDGRQAAWHGGQGHGWMTHFHSVPESGDGIVILTNSQRSWPLMAEVLSDWASWRGLGSLKMGRIAYAIAGIWAFIGVIAFASVWLSFSTIRGVRSGRRRWAPLARESRLLRSVQATAGVALIAALAWSVAQPYLLVSSVFPGIASLAGVALFVLALVLIVTAMFPEGDSGRGRVEGLPRG